MFLIDDFFCPHVAVWLSRVVLNKMFSQPFIGYPSRHAPKKVPQISPSIKSNFAAAKPTTPEPFLCNGKDAAENALTRNLRQQIECLEMEKEFYRKECEKLQQGFHRTSTHDHSLLGQIDCLTQEVKTLREKYAMREQEHAIEIAELRNAVRQDFAACQASDPMEKHRLPEERNRSGTSHQDDDNTAEAHVQELLRNKSNMLDEIFMLQNSNEELKAAELVAKSDMQIHLREKEELNVKLLKAISEQRSSVNEVEIVQAQYREAMRQLAAEQDKYRVAEGREREMTAKLAASSGEDYRARIKDLEQKILTLTTEIQITKHETERAKVAEEKAVADLCRMAQKVSHTEMEMLTAAASEQKAVEELKRKEVEQSNLISEREFYRVTAERMSSENEILKVKESQMEARSASDRAALHALDKKFSSLFDLHETLKRDLAQNAQLKSVRDKAKDNLRREHRELMEKNLKMNRQLDDMRKALNHVSQLYEGVRQHGDMLQTQEILRQTLLRLNSTKDDVHSLMQTQVKMSQDLAHVVEEIPQIISLTPTPSHAARQANFLLEMDNVPPFTEATETNAKVDEAVDETDTPAVEPQLAADE